MLLLSAGKLTGHNSDIAFSGCAATLDGTIHCPMGRVGLFSKARVTARRVVAYNMVLNTGAVLEVKGDPDEAADEDPTEQ